MNWQNHPERREDEVFIGNYHGTAPTGWQSIRLGDVAYDRSGNSVAGLRPAFVQRDEIQSAIETATFPFTKASLVAMLATDFDPCAPTPINSNC